MRRVCFLEGGGGLLKFEGLQEGVMVLRLRQHQNQEEGPQRVVGKFRCEGGWGAKQRGPSPPPPSFASYTRCSQSSCGIAEWSRLE